MTGSYIYGDDKVKSGTIVKASLLFTRIMQEYHYIVVSFKQTVIRRGGLEIKEVLFNLILFTQQKVHIKQLFLPYLNTEVQINVRHWTQCIKCFYFYGIQH